MYKLNELSLTKKWLGPTFLYKSTALPKTPYFWSFSPGLFLLIELTYYKNDTPTIIQIPSDHQIIFSILYKLKVYTQNLLDPFTEPALYT